MDALLPQEILESRVLPITRSDLEYHFVLALFFMDFHQLINLQYTLEGVFPLKIVFNQIKLVPNLPNQLLIILFEVDYFLAFDFLILVYKFDDFIFLIAYGD
jgi:hypothetical protein